MPAAVLTQGGLDKTAASFLSGSCPPSPWAGGYLAALEAYHRDGISLVPLQGHLGSLSRLCTRGTYGSYLGRGAVCQCVDFLLQTHSWI